MPHGNQLKPRRKIKAGSWLLSRQVRITVALLRLRVMRFYTAVIADNLSAGPLNQRTGNR